MRLTTKGRFAVTAMIDIALRSQNGPVSLAAISERQQMSLSYLEQLFGKLRRHGLVESIRGPGGGYRLARKAADISVADIITAVDERASFKLEPRADNDPEDAGRPSASLTRSTEELWASLNQRMLEFLRTVTLQKLAQDELGKGIHIESTPASPRNAIKATPPVRRLAARAPNSVFALGNG